MLPELKRALPNYRRIIENIKKVEDTYGGFKKFTGYSKGGGHAIEFGNLYNTPAEVFNPHIRGDSSVNNLKTKVLIHRINEDPATFGLAFGGRTFKPQDIIQNPKKYLTPFEKRQNLEVRSYPSLLDKNGIIEAHDMDNFTSLAPRKIIPRVHARLLANQHLRSLQQQIELTEMSLQNPKDTYTKFIQRAQVGPSDVPSATRQSRRTPQLLEGRLKRAREAKLDPKFLKQINDLKGNLETVEDDVRSFRTKYGFTRIEPRTMAESGPAKLGFEKLLDIQKDITQKYGEEAADVFAKKFVQEEESMSASKGESSTGVRRRLNISELEQIAEDTEKFVKKYYSNVTRSGNLTNLGAASEAFLATKGIDGIQMEDLANMNAGLLEDTTLPSEFSSEIPVRYARSSATQRLLMKQKLSDRIKSSTRGIYEDHVRPYGQTAAKGISSTINMRGLATSLGIGLGAGVAVGEVGHLLGIDKDQNPIIYAGEVGATAGAISEAASIKLATGAITGAADAGRIASSAASGGVGLVVGSAATYGLNKLMKGANPYVKNITSQVVGGEVGLASGIGLAAASSAATGGLAASIMGAAATEGAVAAGDSWNPSGWAIAIGAGVTAAVGGVVGWIEGNSESKEKAKTAKLQEDATYAGNSDALMAQYSFMREYLTEIGINPHVIASLNSEMLTKLSDANVKPLSSQEFDQTFQQYKNQFSLSGNDTIQGQKNMSQQINERLQQMYIAGQSNLENLVNRVNTAGNLKIKVPDPQLWNSQSLAQEHNKILAQVPQSVLTKLGLQPIQVPLPVSPTLEQIEGSIPSSLDFDQVYQYQTQIALAQKQEDFVKQNVVDPIAQKVSQKVSQVGSAISQIGKDIGTAVGTMVSAANKPPTQAAISRTVAPVANATSNPSTATPIPQQSTTSSQQQVNAFMNAIKATTKTP